MISERALCFPRVPLEIPEDIAQCARDVFCIALVRFVVTWAVSALLAPPPPFPFPVPFLRLLKVSHASASSSSKL